MAEPMITKTCRTCNTEKPVSEFFRDKTRNTWRSRCKHCHVKKKRAYERARGVPTKEDMYRARTRASLDRIPSEPPLKLLEQNAREAWVHHVNVMASDEWRAGYYQSIRKARAEYDRDKWHRRYQENPGNEIYRAKWKKAKIRQATPPWVDREAIKAIYMEAGKIRAQGRTVHVDHIIPIRGKLVSGLHVPWNLQVMDAADNFAKRNGHDPMTYQHQM